MNFKKIISLILICILSIFFIACNEKKVTKVNLDTQTITDMVGRKVVLPKKITKVIIVGSVALMDSYVFALGESDKLIMGLPDFAKKKRFKYTNVFAPQLQKQTLMQGKDRGPLVEKIINAKPDFVLTMDRSTANILAPKGIKTVVLTHWKNTKDVEEVMTLLGKIFNKQEQAKKYIAYFKETIEKAKKLTAAIPENKRPTVLYAKMSKMAQPHLIAEWWIKTAGGISVTDNGRKQESFHFSIEQILGWNPDIIIVNNDKDLAFFKEDDRLKTLKAVKDGEIFASPTGAQTWAHLTTEQPLMVLWALNKFYPKLYSVDELKKDVEYFYSTFFKTKLTNNQIMEIITANYK